MNILSKLTFFLPTFLPKSLFFVLFFSLSIFDIIFYNVDTCDSPVALGVSLFFFLPPDFLGEGFSAVFDVDLTLADFLSAVFFAADFFRAGFFSGAGSTVSAVTFSVLLFQLHRQAPLQ